MTFLKRVDGPHVGEHPKVWDGGSSCPNGHSLGSEAAEGDRMSCSACGWEDVVTLEKPVNEEG